jgi:hypothetical protein
MFLSDDGVLFTGDVLVASSGATVLLPGHGEPWRGDAA